MMTATQMQLATYNELDAFGPAGIAMIIAGQLCRLRLDGDWWEVRLDSGAIYNVPAGNSLAYVETLIGLCIEEGVG